MVGRVEPATAAPPAPAPPAPAPPAPPAPPSESIEVRRHRLTVARRRATAVLGAVTVLFVVVSAVGAHGTALGYVQAAAIASLVGGLADWFAVTALFRRPLGLPIPHTAIVVERKDRFVETIGSFVQENFLSADAVSERLRLGAGRAAPGWLADRRGQRGALRRPGRGSGRHGGRGPARRGRPARADRRTDPDGRLHRGGPAGRADPAADHRGRTPHRGVQRPAVRGRRLSGRPLRRAARDVRVRGPPLDPRSGLPAGLRPALPPAAGTARGDGGRPRRPDPAPVRGLAGSPARAARDRPGAARARGTAQARGAGHAPRCGTGRPRCGRSSRKPCGPRRPTRSPSCAAG